jgi:hypothetical protein
MNHLSRKKRLYGAGKKPKVKPAVLSPPKIGDFQFGASFSYIETLDLISDGPIEGLVDSKGRLLDDTDLSRGIYFDGTPVAVAIDSNEDSESELTTEDEVKTQKSISTFVNIDIEDDGGSSIVQDTWGTWNRPIKLTFKKLVGNGPAFVSRGGEFSEISYDPSALGLFANRMLDSQILSDNSIRFFRAGHGRWKEYNLLFTEGSTIQNSNFFVGFHNSSDSYSDFHIMADTVMAEKNSVDFKKGVSGASFFESILDAWNSYGPATTVGEDVNPFMRDLIGQKMDQAFGNYDWRSANATELYKEFFTQNWQAGYMLMYYPDRDVFSSGVSSIQFPIDKAKEVCVVPTEASGKHSDAFRLSSYIDLLIPIFNSDGSIDVSKDVLGGSFIFYRQEILNSLKAAKNPNRTVTNKYSIQRLLKFFRNTTQLTITTVKKLGFNSKYNFNNVLIEARRGYENQSPFHFFNKIHIDKSVEKNVYGPFKLSGQVQRIKRINSQNKSNFRMDIADYSGPDLTLQGGLPTEEGSNDTLRAGGVKNYSSWNNQNKEYLLEERASPITYYINNPNVSEIFVTLKIDSLFDTVEKQYDDDDDDFKVGDKLPAILNVEIEVGKVLSNGFKIPTVTKTYRIAALMEGPTLLDIGNPSNPDSPDQFKHVKDIQNLDGDAALSTPFPLPRVSDYSSNNSYSSPEKRYVQVKKLSTETFSVLISKELTFYKVTEIIPVNLKYPFSAIVGTKIDSKSFSSAPQRSFDARLKLVQIPKNYFPTEESGRKIDKRYYETTQELDEASEERKSIYQGDWDGSFKTGWTDNPAWILYDLLTNTRYGLGRYVDSDDINKWELYKIGRFCDGVDANGVFEGVPDGRGGLEPRYSCNIMFKSDEKIFDSIQLISKLFRGQTFFRASEVSFSDERIKSPMATFNNNNVKDGAFNYSNLRRDQQFNTVEVSYLDRFENFTPKVEVVEDEEDIRSRGVFKQRVDGLGVTSRSMARRIGQHLIYKTIKENQRVVFTSGLEALLCQPGDLIIVDDDLKNEKSNFGKVLSVDVDNEYIQLSGPYSSSSMTGVLTVYSPTGESSIDELSDIASKKRSRTDTFTITGVSTNSDFDDIYTGLYNFSGYRSGYSDSDIEDLTTFSEYALYTGTGDNMLYFGTDYTGWTFATGLEEANRDFVAKSTGVQNLAELNTGIVSTYSSSDSDKRATPEIDISGFFSGDLNILNARGILESDIVLNSEPQIVTLITTSQGTGDGFSFVSGVDKPEYLQFIKLGSPYRFDLKNADDILYKIDSIKENSPNEYLVSAAKFETGKFSLIENNISLDRKENTYDYNVATQIGDVTYTGLSAPENLSITTGEGTETDTFYISGDWDEVTSKASYEAVLRYPNGGSFSTGIAEESVKFDNLSSIGNYALSVRAIGSSTDATKTLDSDFSSLRTFVLYTELEEFDKSFINNITFK